MIIMIIKTNRLAGEFLSYLPIFLSQMVTTASHPWPNSLGNMGVILSCIIRSHFPLLGFPDGSVIKNPPANLGDKGDKCLIPSLGRSPEGENSNPLQYSCLGNPIDREA